MNTLSIKWPTISHFRIAELTEDANLQRVLLVSSAAAAMGAFYYWISRPKKLKTPPGPRCWPLIGAIGISNRDSDQMMEMRKKYGDIFSWYYFGQYVVVLGSYDLIREANVLTRAGGEPLADRPQNILKHLRSKNKDGHGIFNSNGETWRVHRRFILQLLRDVGYGRSVSEAVIQEQIEWAIDQMLNDSSAYRFEAPVENRTDIRPGSIEINPKIPLLRAIVNVLCRLLLQETGSDDPELLPVIIKSTTVLDGFKIFSVPTFQMLVRLPFFIPVFVNYIKAVSKFRNYIHTKFNEHEKSLPMDIEADQTSSVIDSYIIEKRHQDAKFGPGNHTYTNVQIVSTILEMFFAGNETTGSSIRWALLMMARYPHIQKKAQEEIERVIGDRMPNIADRLELPYVEAILCEVQRYFTPINITSKKVSEPIKVGGYDLPTGTIVVNMYNGAHRDPKSWPVPDRFAPEENFLGEPKDGMQSSPFPASTGMQGDHAGARIRNKAIQRTEYLLSFGIGKRLCPGENLGRAELFIFLVRILQKFDIRPPREGRESLSEKPCETSPFSLSAPFKIIFVPRS